MRRPFSYRTANIVSDVCWCVVPDRRTSAVCKKVLTTVHDGLDAGDAKDLVAIEGAIDSECAKMRKAKPDG